MIIRSESWHYKWIASKWDYRPASLCWYFWKVVLSIILQSLAGVAIFILGCLIIVMLTSPFWQWFVNGIPLEVSILAFLTWFAIGVTMNRVYRRYLYDSKQLKRKRPVYKEPSLVSQYLHAQHRKICPLLEYEYDQ